MQVESTQLALLAAVIAVLLSLGWLRRREVAGRPPMRPTTPVIAFLIVGVALTVAFCVDAAITPGRLLSPFTELMIWYLVMSVPGALLWSGLVLVLNARLSPAPARRLVIAAGLAVAAVLAFYAIYRVIHHTFGPL